jgi:hypothetical protein
MNLPVLKKKTLTVLQNARWDPSRVGQSRMCYQITVQYCRPFRHTYSEIDSYRYLSPFFEASTSASHALAVEHGWCLLQKNRP